uniref:TAFA chemokine like family member 5 n=1 Tax=Gadus morhua TaxID=8049 RepID=A0A8C5A9F1_GADMO
MHGLSFPTNQLFYDIRAVTTHTHTHTRLCQGVCVRLVIHVLSYWLMEIDKRQLAAGTCEIVTLDRDSSQPRRTIARQTARCACKKGQIAGTTRASPACVDAAIVRKRQWCEMFPCLEDEGCDLLVNRSGWTCTQPGGRVKTTTVSPPPPPNPPPSPSYQPPPSRLSASLPPSLPSRSFIIPVSVSRSTPPSFSLSPPPLSRFTPTFSPAVVPSSLSSPSLGLSLSL